MSRKSIEQYLFETEISCNILNVTIDQCILDKYLKVLFLSKKTIWPQTLEF